VSAEARLSWEKERLATETDFFVPGPGEGATQAERRVVRRRWLRRLVPELALLAALFTLFYCLIPFHAPRALFRNPDTGWHIITGQRILDEGRLPATDPYSFARAGRPWFAWDWGADCLMGEVERQAGLTGVAWTFAIAIAAVTWLWFRLNWAVNGNLVAACLLFPLMLGASSRQWDATPQVFGWIPMLLTVRFLESAGQQEHEASALRVKHALAFGAGAAWWANFQSSFWFLPGAALLYAISHFVRPMIWNLDPRIERRRARWYASAAAFAAAGSLIHPYGSRPYGHALSMLFGSGSVSPERLGDPAIFVAAAVAATGGILALGQKKLAQFLLTALAAAAAFGPGRMAGIVPVVLLPLANGSMTDALRRAHDLRPWLRTRIHAFLLVSDQLRLIDGRLRGLWLAPVAAAAVLAWLLIPSVDAHTGFAPDLFPVYAAGELGSLRQDARLLAPAAYSAYIVYRYRGERSVFLYSLTRDATPPEEGLREQYNHLMEVRPAWQDEIKSLGITHALLPRDHPLTSALELSGWRIQFRDDLAALFVNPLADGSRE